MADRDGWFQTVTHTHTHFNRLDLESKRHQASDGHENNGERGGEKYLSA